MEVNVESTLKCEPNDAQIHYLSYVLLYEIDAIEFLKKEDYKNALEEVKAAIKIVPTFEYSRLLAEILESISEYNEALTILEKAIEKYPEQKQNIESVLNRIQKANIKYCKLPPGNLRTHIDPKEREEYLKYYNWIKQQGITTERLDLQYFNDSYRGLVAKQNIHKGDLLLKVPRDAMITLKIVRASPICAKLIELKTTLIYKNNSLISVFALTELRNDKSQWQLFFKAFPKSADSFPTYFTPNELKLLEGSLFLGK